MFTLQTGCLGCGRRRIGIFRAGGVCFQRGSWDCGSDEEDVPLGFLRARVEAERVVSGFVEAFRRARAQLAQTNAGRVGFILGGYSEVRLMRLRL